MTGAFYDSNSASAEAELHGTLAEMKALQIKHEESAEALELAKDHLTSSLRASLWESDGNHMKFDDGGSVFLTGQAVVAVLVGLQERTSIQQLSDFINMIVDADHTLAFVAVSDAEQHGFEKPGAKRGKGFEKILR